jgi:chorismate mutase
MNPHTTTEETISTDPVMRQLRQQVSDTDRLIVELVNQRLTLVRRIRTRKDSLGIPFLDHAREEWMLRYLTRANRGPLTAAGLEELHEELLALTKREVERTTPDVEECLTRG